MAPLFAAGGPENANKMMNQYRGLLFPEEKFDTFNYMEKAKKFFDRVRGMDIRVSPLKTTRARRM